MCGVLAAGGAILAVWLISCRLQAVKSRAGGGGRDTAIVSTGSVYVVAACHKQCIVPWVRSSLPGIQVTMLASEAF